MPAPSRAMQQAAAIAKHHPEKLHKENRSLLKMTDEQLEEYASTPHEGLPKHAGDRIPLSELMKGRKKRKKKK
jgi:hypothetical protein